MRSTPIILAIILLTILVPEVMQRMETQQASVEEPVLGSLASIVVLDVNTTGGYIILENRLARPIPVLIASHGGAESFLVMPGINTIHTDIPLDGAKIALPGGMELEATPGAGGLVPPGLNVYASTYTGVLPEVSEVLAFDVDKIIFKHKVEMYSMYERTVKPAGAARTTTALTTGTNARQYWWDWTQITAYSPSGSNNTCATAVCGYYTTFYTYTINRPAWGVFQCGIDAKYTPSAGVQGRTRTNVLSPVQLVGEGVSDNITYTYPSRIDQVMRQDNIVVPTTHPEQYFNKTTTTILFTQYLTTGTCGASPCQTVVYVYNTYETTKSIAGVSQERKCPDPKFAVKYYTPYKVYLQHRDFTIKQDLKQSYPWNLNITNTVRYMHGWIADPDPEYVPGTYNQSLIFTGELVVRITATVRVPVVGDGQVVLYMNPGIGANVTSNGWRVNTAFIQQVTLSFTVSGDDESIVSGDEYGVVTLTGIARIPFEVELVRENWDVPSWTTETVDFWIYVTLKPTYQYITFEYG